MTKSKRTLKSKRNEFVAPAALAAALAVEEEIGGPLAGSRATNVGGKKVPVMRNECVFCHLVHTVECPCIHTNGSAAENLRDDISVAVDATHVAIQRIEWAVPAGRDYYVQGGEAIRQSRVQHASRMTRLQDVAKELWKCAITCRP